MAGFASFASMPAGDRRSFSAPAGDTTRLNAPGSRQMRARETNGTILIAVSARRGEMFLNATQWKAFAKDVEMGRMGKHALWRRADGKYHVDQAAGGAELIGMIESVTMSNQMVRFHVTVRGVVSVPIWWFTKQEFESRVHGIWGPVFTKQVGTTVRKYFEGRAAASVSADYATTRQKHRSDRILSTCYSCFFRV